jgi:hypothetical protein
MDQASTHPHLLAFMVAAPPNSSGVSRAPAASAPIRDWRHWLLLGLLFGVGHGVTERLIRGQGDGAGPAGSQNFGVQPFPGESLEALRRRHGDAPKDVWVDFAALEQEKRNQQDQADADKQRAELEDRQQAEDRQAQQQAERARLDALDGEPPSTLPAETTTPPESLPQPAAPNLEVPLPSAGTSPAPAAGTGIKLPPLPEAPPAPTPTAQP